MFISVVTAAPSTAHRAGDRRLGARVCAAAGGRTPRTPAQGARRGATLAVSSHCTASHAVARRGRWQAACSSPVADLRPGGLETQAAGNTQVTKGDRERTLTAAMGGKTSKAAQRNTARGNDHRHDVQSVAAAPRWQATELIDRLDGDEALAQQLVSLFLSEYPKLLAALRASLDSGQPDHVRRAAHAAKGCIANFVQDGPHVTAYEIERLGAEGRVDDARPLLARFEGELDAIVASMRAFSPGSSCAS